MGNGLKSDGVVVDYGILSASSRGGGDSGVCDKPLANTTAVLPWDLFSEVSSKSHNSLVPPKPIGGIHHTVHGKGTIPDVSSTSIISQQGNRDMLWGVDYPLLGSTTMMSEEEHLDADYHGMTVKPKQSIGLEKCTPFTVCKQLSQLSFLSRQLNVTRLPDNAFH